MQNVRATTVTARDDIVDADETWRPPESENPAASSNAAVRSNTARLARRVEARDLHPGDVMQQYDWLLHVREVNISSTAVAIAVTEFEFQLLYAVDSQVSLAA